MALSYVITALDDSSDPGGWSMNGINLSGKPGMVHPMQMPPVRTTADPRHPAPLSHIALHHRPPASELHDAQSRTVLIRKLALLIVSAAVAAFMQRLPKEPGWAQRFVERDHGRPVHGLMQQVEQRLHEVIGLHRTS